LSQLKERPKEGFTISSVLALVFAGLALQPTIIYLSLVSPAGATAGWAIPMYITLFMMVEVSSLLGKTISRQEATIAYLLASQVATYTFFGGFIFTEYLRTSPYTIQFGIAKQIPTWAAPLENSSCVLRRTFISPEWAMPIGISLLSATFVILIDLSLMFLLNKLYLETERLPFPIASVHASAIETLSEKSPDRIRILTIAGFVSFLYGFMLYGFPELTKAFGIGRVIIVPVPWIDLTEWVKIIMPGATFGVATDLSTIGVAWMLPFDAIVWMFIGSILIFVMGNAIALNVKLPLFYKWQLQWNSLMGLTDIVSISVLDIWISFQIGAAIATAVIPTISNIRYFSKAIKSLLRPTKHTEEIDVFPISLAAIFGMYLIGSVGGVSLTYILVPKFPVILSAVVWILLPLLQALVYGRTFGEIGVGVSIPYVSQATIILSGYNSADVWFSPLMASSIAGSPGINAALLTHDLKVCELTNTKKTSYLKAYLMIIPLAWLFGFIFWSLFWSMAPIPSNFYPYTTYSWPLSAINTAIWISRSAAIFNVGLMLVGFGLTGIGYLLAEFLRLPFSVFGFVAGINTSPAVAFTYLIGGLIGNYIEKKFGSQWWDQNKGTLVAGLFLGLGLVGALTAAIAIVSASFWALPY